MSQGETATNGVSAAQFQRRPWGRGDLVALLVWTLAIAAFFWDAVRLQARLFYFDITEINYPYRAFFAEELRGGPVLAVVPGPLLRPAALQREPGGISASAQVPALSLAGDLAGVQPRHGALDLADRRGDLLWLRRHVGPAGALTGAAVFGLSGFAWGHLIHTSMINALASVPFVIWGLEWSWESGRWRGAVLGGLALACQVFAGHLQDALLTVVLVGLYGLYRAATERDWKARLRALGMAVVLVVVGVLVSAVQWVPSKELLDRSPAPGA